MQLHQRVFTTCMLCIVLPLCVLGAQREDAEEKQACILAGINDVDGKVQRWGRCVNPRCEVNKARGYNGYCVQLKRDAKAANHKPGHSIRGLDKFCQTCQDNPDQEKDLWWDDCCECGERYIVIDVANEADSFMKANEELMCLIRGCEYLRDSFNHLGHQTELGDEKKKEEYTIKRDRMYQQLTIFNSPFYTTDCNLFRNLEEERYRTEEFLTWRRRRVFCKWIGAALALSGGILSMQAVGKKFIEAKGVNKDFSDLWMNFAKDLELIFGQTKRVIAKKRSSELGSFFFPHHRATAAMTKDRSKVAIPIYTTDAGQAIEVDIMHFKTPQCNSVQPDMALLDFIEKLHAFRERVHTTKKITEEQRHTIKRFKIELSIILGEGSDIPREATFKWTKDRGATRENYKKNNTIDADYELRFSKFEITFNNNEEAANHFENKFKKGYFARFVDYINCKVVGKKIEGTICLEEYATVKHIYKTVLRLTQVDTRSYPELKLETVPHKELTEELNAYLARRAEEKKRGKVLNTDHGQEELQYGREIAQLKIAIQPVLETDETGTAMKFLEQLWVTSIVEKERIRVTSTVESNTKNINWLIKKNSRLTRRLRTLENMLQGQVLRINSTVNVMQRSFSDAESDRSAASVGTLSSGSLPGVAARSSSTGSLESRGKVLLRGVRARKRLKNGKYTKEKHPVLPLGDKCGAKYESKQGRRRLSEKPRNILLYDLLQKM